MEPSINPLPLIRVIVGILIFYINSNAAQGLLGGLQGWPRGIKTMLFTSFVLIIRGCCVF